MKEMVLESVYLTEKFRYIIQMFGSIVDCKFICLSLQTFLNNLYSQ